MNGAGMNRRAVASMLILGIAVRAGTAMAAGLDGTAPIICATTQTFDCAAAGDCISDSPDAINLPRLLRLDFVAKKALTKRPDGAERVAEIGALTIQEGELVLQGVQAGHGWTMAISRGTGAMSLTIAGDGSGFVVFGTCTAL
jgi:hypothetical protein